MPHGDERSIRLDAVIRPANPSEKSLVFGPKTSDSVTTIATGAIHEQGMNTLKTVLRQQINVYNQ
jgi:hypothetical protein